MSLHQVTLTQTLKGQVIQNVFHLENPDGAISASQISVQVFDHWIPEVKKLQGTPLVYQHILVQNLSNPAESPHLAQIASPGLATGFDPRLPPLCIVMQKRTAVAGRRGRGRYYISGWDNGAQETTGTWEVGHLGGIFQQVTTALEQKWISPGVSALKLVVAGRNPDGAWTSRDCTSLLMRAIPGYQRRRNIGVGI